LGEGLQGGEILLRRSMNAKQKVTGVRLSVVVLACETACMNAEDSAFQQGASRNQPVNDNDEPFVTLIAGRVRRRKGGRPLGAHVMLVAADDDSAVRMALEALAREGYAEAELDQIGEMQGAPDEEPHLSAYQGALEGEVSIVTFDEPT
jgi:hypothetical protein